MTIWELFVKVSGDNSGFKKSIQDSGASLEKFSKVAEGVGTKLAASLGFAGVGITAVAAANKFEEAAVRIQRATGATGEKLEALEASFTNVYKQTAASAEQVSQALALISTRTGATGEALEGLTLKMLKLAKTQGEDVAAITPLITRLFGDWSIATNRQGDAMDYLRGVSQQTGTSVARLSEQVVYAGAPMRQLGYSFEQAVALIGKFEKEGVNTELVLGGMKAALQKFAKDGVTDTAAAWRDFVVGVKDGSITLQDVMKEVGAKRGVDLYKAITEGRFEIDKMVDSIKTLAADGGANVETLRTKFTKWQHSVEALIVSHKDLLVTVGMLTPLAVALKDATKFIIGNISTITSGIVALASNPVVLALLAGGAAIGIGYSQLSEATAGLHSLDSAFSKWITNQATGAKGADELAKAEARVNDALEKGLISKEQTAKLLEMIHGAQAKLVGQDWNAYASSIGLPKITIAKTGAPTEQDLEAAKKAAEEYARAVANALNVVGISSKRYQELGDALLIVQKEYRAGRVTVEQWTQALMNAGKEIEKREKKPLELIPVDLNNTAYDQQLQALNSLPRTYDAIAESINLTLAPLSDFIAEQDRAARDAEIIAEAFKTLGVKSAAELQNVADKAQEAYQLIAEDGKSTAVDIARAWIASERAQIAATQAKGEAVSEEYKKLLDQIEKDLDEATNVHAKAVDKQKTKVSEFGRQVSTIMTDLSRGIADAIVNAKGLGDAFVHIGKQISESILRYAIEKGLKVLIQNLDGVLGKLGAIGKALGGWASPGTSAASGVASGAASSGGGFSSGVGAVASGGLMNTIGAVGSVVSAVSGVIGNFQMAGMNKTLDLIEKSTRYLEINFRATMDAVFYKYLPKLEDINLAIYNHIMPAMAEINDSIQAKGVGTGAGGFSFVNCTFTGTSQSDVSGFMNAWLLQARAAGAKI